MESGKLPVDVSGPFPDVSDFLSRLLDLQLWLKPYLRSDVWTFRGHDDRCGCPGMWALAKRDSLL